MSELFDKEVNAQKREFEKIFQGSLKLLQAHGEVCDENKTKKQEKQQPPKIFFDGRKEFIRSMGKTGVMDIK